MKKSKNTEANLPKTVGLPRQPVVDYLEEYAYQDSQDLQRRLTTLHLTLQNSFNSKNTGNWSNCCSNHENRSADYEKGYLGHTDLQSTRKWISRRLLESFDDFKSFMLKILPRNELGQVRLPQINMRHGGSAQQPPRRTVLTERPIDVEEDHSKVDENMTEAERDRAEVARLRTMCTGLKQEVFSLQSDRERLKKALYVNSAHLGSLLCDEQVAQRTG